MNLCILIHWPFVFKEAINKVADQNHLFSSHCLHWWLQKGLFGVLSKFNLTDLAHSSACSHMIEPEMIPRSCSFQMWDAQLQIASTMTFWKLVPFMWKQKLLIEQAQLHSQTLCCTFFLTAVSMLLSQLTVSLLHLQIVSCPMKLQIVSQHTPLKQSVDRLAIGMHQLMQMCWVKKLERWQN